MESCRIDRAETSWRRFLPRRGPLAILVSACLCAALGVPTLSAASAAVPTATRLAPQINQFGSSIWGLQGLGSVWTSSPVVATIDNVRAVVLATLTGEIYVVNARTGQELPGWPQWVHIHSSEPTGVDSSPAVAYLDGPDRPPSIIVGAGSLWRRDQQGGLEAFYANGKVRFVFQTRRTFNPWGTGHNDYSDPVFATPAVGDITGTGQQDIVFGSYDHNIYAVQPNGHLVRGFPIQRADTIWSSPALVDTSRTGRDDIIMGGDSSGWDHCYGGWIVDYRYGTRRPNLVWQRCVSQSVWSSPAVGILNKSGRPAVVVGSSYNSDYWRNPATDEIIAVYADNGQRVPGWPVKARGPTFGSPAIGRVDGQTAVVATSCAHCLNGPATVTAWNGAGRRLWSKVFDPHHEATSSPLLVDVTGGGDKGDDVLIGGAWGLYLISGSNGKFLYDTGAQQSAIQSGCDVAGTPAVAYVPGARPNGWMLYFACGGPTIAAKLVAYPFRMPPAISNPPAWPEWRANADRTGVPDPLSVPRTSCGKSSGTPGGLRLVSSDGALFDLGNLPYCGGLNQSVLPTDVVSMATTPSGRGYWLLLGDGSVYAFGDAKWYGDLRGGDWRGGPVPPGDPVVGIAATPDGKGYLVTSAQGSVYAFGDAKYRGSRGGQSTDGAVVGIEVDNATGGYWLATSRGAVYAFNAPYHGSASSRPLAAPIVGLAAVPDGSGYWLAGASGNVVGFGVRTYGTAIHGHPSSPVVGIAAQPTGKGYWLVHANGAISRFGGDGPYGKVSGGSIAAFSAA